MTDRNEKPWSLDLVMVAGGSLLLLVASTAIRVHDNGQTKLHIERLETENHTLLAQPLPASVALIDAGRVYPGAHVCESEPHPLLMALASEHARYMSRHRRQGHQRWDERAREIMAELGQVSPAEICAESWDRQAHDPLPEVATEMFRCWRQSSGHWSVASRKHRWFGCDMAQGRNGIWYAVVVTAD